MNKYEIVGIVGEGAYGIVYKAKNKDNGEHGKSILFQHVKIPLFIQPPKLKPILYHINHFLYYKQLP